MKRILMTADTIGGVWNYSIELAKALAGHGVQVDLATMGELPSDKQRHEASCVPGLSLHESTYKLEWMEDPWTDVVEAGRWLLQLERKLSPDIIHLNGYAHGALPWQAPCMVVAHSCVLSWWKAVKGEEAPPEWDDYRSEVQRGLRSAQLVVAPTHAMLREVHRYYRVTRLKSRVIYNSRDAKNFGPGDRECFVFSAGRLWDEAKNTAALELVAPRLKWPVYVAGDSDKMLGFKAEARNMFYLGRLSQRDMACWYGKAPIYAMPARYEPFGLSVLEAALSGCALVLGDIPSLRELWDDAAIFVPPDDHHALEHALSWLIEDGKLRSMLASKASARALTFSPAATARAYLAAYEELLEQKSSIAEAPVRRVASLQ
jgi:glycogen synthase